MTLMVRVSSHLDLALGRLRDDVLRLSDMADRAIDQAMRALRDMDSALAQEVITRDETINRFRYQIEQNCYQMIALHQPTARDMRSIITAIHIVVELERIADYAMGIAKLTLRMEKTLILKAIPEVLLMHQIAKDMLKNSMEAYLRWDQHLAQKTFDRDTEVDRLDKVAGEKWIKMMEANPACIQSGSYWLWITHNMERIADRITNICERVIFMTTGEIVVEISG